MVMRRVWNFWLDPLLPAGALGLLLGVAACYGGRWDGVAAVTVFPFWGWGVAGLGVAVGRNPLVEPDLKAGRLVVPFEFKRSSDFAYYLVYPPEAIRRRKIKAFRDWIVSLSEVAQQAG